MKKIKDTITQTRNLIKKAVQRQMIEVPLEHLSGGLDSSIVNFAKEIDPKIKCFTINVVNKNKPEDNVDLKYAIKVAKHLEVPIEIVD